MPRLMFNLERDQLSIQGAADVQLTARLMFDWDAG